MLRQLRVKNFVLIADLDMEFSEGLSIITGETGAGKSILLGALGLVLGEKSSPDMIRAEAEKCVVEGVFELKDHRKITTPLEKLGVELVGDELLIRREITSDGRIRCFVNDVTVTAKTLKSIGDLLVDLHGQHEHQALFRLETHLQLIDCFGGFENLTEKIKEAFNRTIKTHRRIAELSRKSEEAEEKKDLYSFQLEEITKAHPDPNEAERLERERKVLENSEALIQNARNLYQLLYGSDDSISDQLGMGLRLLEESVSSDASLQEYLGTYKSVLYQIEDLGSFFRDYAENLESDPLRLEMIRERLALLASLRKKYGGTLDKVLEYKAFLEGALNSSENLTQEIAETEKRLIKEKEELSKLCNTLSAKRKQVANRLSREVTQSLAKLGMKGALFEVRLFYEEDPEGEVEIDGHHFRTSETGIEKAEFFISTNPGQEPRPLVKIASGGEVSRVMLALKSALAEADAVPTLVFDEIDIGISGRVAEAVGKQLQKLSTSHQTICITHLPQIAKMADRHFSVTKSVKDGRGVTNVSLLNHKQRIDELARLLGGEEISDITLKHAEELLNGH